MAAPSFRTLRLLSLLQARRFWSGAELCRRLEVSLRTLRRDVHRLRELGYPVAARPGVDGGYSLAAGAALPPLVLDDDEAVALAVGLQSAAQAPVAGLAESSVQALAKIVQVMPARLRRRVHALRAVTVPAGWGSASPTVDPAALTLVALACRDGERLRFSYSDAGGSRTDRLVEPFRLVPSGWRWYLVAYDLERGDWRSFRLDRLTAPQGTGARFAPRRLPAEDAAAFVRAGFGAGTPTGLRHGAPVRTGGGGAAADRPLGDGGAGRTGELPGADGRRERRLGGFRPRGSRRGCGRGAPAGAARAPARLGGPARPGHRRPPAAGSDST